MPAFPKVDDALLRRLDVPIPRYTSYPTAPMWSESVGESAYVEALDAASKSPERPLSLYFHIPFCRERCSFCGCNVVISRSSSAADAYLEALIREMDLVAARLGERRSVSQIHWGGGTPTFLEEDQIEALWTAICKRFHVLPDAEAAIEIDPKVTTTSQLSVLRSLGFNRMSMGVQDLDPSVQEAISRIQSVEATRTMLETARNLGFRGINFDLIYGLPRQTKESWSRTLAQVLALAPDRVAAYAFAYVPDARPNQRRLPQAQIPRGTDKLDLFRLTWEAFVNAGYQQIGMDHFSRPDDELSLAQKDRTLTRNFQGYSVRAATDVVAFGVSAIADVSGLYAQNTHSIARYKEAVEAGKLATERGFHCSAEDVRRRAIINQLMCNFHLELARPEDYPDELRRLRDLAREGLVEVDGGTVSVTPLGRIFVRNVAAVFDGYLDPAQTFFSRAV